MRSALFLVTATAVTHCGIPNLGSEMMAFSTDYKASESTETGRLPEPKVENRIGISNPRYNYSETFMEEVGPSTQKQNDANERQNDDVATALKDNDTVLNEVSFKNNFEQGIEQSFVRSDIVSGERQAEKIFTDAESSIRTKRQVLKSFTIPNSTWKDGIFYMFNTTDYRVYKAFKMGVRVWRDATCIEFVENKKAKDKVVVVKDAQCFARTGQTGGDQLLSLSDNDATEGSAVHEIGHVLGLFHTMERSDRDSYITIVEQNVKPQYIDQFIKLDSTVAELHGTSYDYGSVMHYNELSFSANNLPTLIAKDPLYQKTMGSEQISFSDIFVVNEHHGCNAKCKKPASAKCANGGFPHPRNCSVCICPSGYGGALCDRRPSGCGEDLVASPEKQVVDMKLGFGFQLRDQYDFCHYMITAPKGRKIEVEVRSVSYGYDISGCVRGGVEIKAQKDQRLTGYRFCSMSGSGVPVVSTSNPLPVILFNRYCSMEVTFTYRFI